MARSSFRNTTEIGNRLERKAFAHLEALGYRVEGNVRLKGAQTDLILSKQIPGFGSLIVIAEVKYLSSGSVKRDVVESFVYRLRNNENVTAGIIISNRPFSMSAKEAAASNGRVKLLTIEDLTRGLLNYDGACVRHVMEYEAGNAFNTYTTIAARLPSQKKTVTDVAEYLTAWAIGDEMGPSYLVSGDFGSGKTTTLERIRYDLCRSFIEGISKRFPILLRLRLLLSHSSLLDFVRSELLSQHYIDIPSNFIQREIVGGKFVLLLDGFDEVNTAANAQERAYYIQRLGLLLAGHCPCIIATRPTYFDSLDEMKLLLLRQGAVLKGLEESLERRILRSALQSFDPQFPDPIDLPGETNTLELKLWGASDIARYLKVRANEIQERLGVSTADFQSIISKVYNLSDLISRPLLLAIIVDTTVENGLSILDHSSGIGPARLYAIYLKACAQREAGGRKTEVTFSFDERLEIARRLAIKMLEKGSVQLSAEDIATVLQRWRRVQSSDKSFLDRALTDIRVCTFLSWANDDSLRFAHLSYLEFFVAQKIYLDGLENPLFLRRYLKYSLSAETIAFLADFARTDESFRSRLALAFKNDAQSRSEIAGITMMAGCLDILIDISGVQFSSLRLSKLANRSAKLSNVRFDDVTCVETSWRSIRVLDSSFRRVKFFECLFDRAVLDMHGHEVSFTSCDFKGSDLTIDGEGFVLEATKFASSRLTIEGFCRVSGVEICDNSVFRVTKGGFSETSRVSVSASLFIDEIPEVRFSDFKTGTFKSCKLLGLTISSAQAQALLEGKETSVFIDRCSGVLIVEDLAQDLREPLKRHFPQLMIISSEEYKIALERNSTLDGRQNAIRASISRAIGQSGIRKHATGPWAAFSDAMDLLAKRGALKQDYATATSEVVGAEETAARLQGEMTALSEKLAEDRGRKDDLSSEISDRRGGLDGIDEAALLERDISLHRALEALRETSAVCEQHDRSSADLSRRESEHALATQEVDTAKSQIAEAEADRLRDRIARAEIVPIAELADEAVSSEAIHLRSLLAPNLACPVCGSTDHPHLAHPSALNEMAARLRRRREELDTMLTATGQRLDAATRSLSAGESRQAETNRGIDVARGQVLAANDEARSVAANLSAEIDAAKAELAIWQAVDDAVGSASGDRFRRFVQGITLDHMVQLANDHLHALTPRYRLARGAASDLALHVIDRDMGDEVRGTRSLSGGERFLVSLALALALSGLEGRSSFVDTLFIDEGFGSLDAETLDLAVDALETLQGRGQKVGVITHVAAMIERIAVQVRVEKRGAGRSGIKVSDGSETIWSM